MYVIQYCFICRPSDSTVLEDAGNEPRKVATLALTGRDALTTRLDLIQHNSTHHHFHHFFRWQESLSLNYVLLWAEPFFIFYRRKPVMPIDRNFGRTTYKGPTKNVSGRDEVGVAFRIYIQNRADCSDSCVKIITTFRRRKWLNKRVFWSVLSKMLFLPWDRIFSSRWIFGQASRKISKKSDSTGRN